MTTLAEQMLEDAKRFLGIAPYNELSNTSMDDPYFSLHCEKTYGEAAWNDLLNKLQAK